MAIRSSQAVPRREPCAKCGNPVYIAERLTVGKSLYHRTCFRCARCDSQLTLANYYETETPNQFCCETCPDEEATKTPPPAEKSVLNRSLSDEEKSAGLKKITGNNQRMGDEYSVNFESALENPSVLNSSEYASARSRFLTANFVDSSDGETPPELPKTKPPDIVGTGESVEPSSARAVKTYGNKNNNSDNKRTITESPDRVSVNISDRLSESDIKQAKTVTKEAGKSPRNSSNVRGVNTSAKADGKVTTAPSLVKNRMRMFEKSPNNDNQQSPPQLRISSSIPESAKRPLTDISFVSPEKRISRPESPSKSNPVVVIESSLDPPRKSTKELAETQAKSLNFLLQKQIALKDGKITPKSLINRGQDDPAPNVNSSESVEKGKVENRQKTESAMSSSSIFKKSPKVTPKDLTKSTPISSVRKKPDSDKGGVKSLLFRKTPSEKVSTTKTPISPERDKIGQNLKSKFKMSSERDKPKVELGSKPSKQKGVEDVGDDKLKLVTKNFPGRNWKDTRKENMYRSPYRDGASKEKLKTDALNLDVVGSAAFSNPSPVRRISSEGGISNNESSPFRRVASTSRLDKLRLRLHTSHPNLSNASDDPSTSCVRTQSDDEHLPMRSIENLCKSNSDENIAASKEAGTRQTSRLNSVSAIKDKFECNVVVESRPLRLEKDVVESRDKAKNIHPLTDREGDIDLENRSVSETLMPAKSDSESSQKQQRQEHGEVLHHGYITVKEDVTERSEDPIVIDLIEGDAEEESAVTEGPSAVITISDDSLIVISASSQSLNRTGLSEKEVYPEDLNPFGEDDNEDDKNPFAEDAPTKTGLNPFEDEDDGADEDDDENRHSKSPKPTPAVRKKLIIPAVEQSQHEGDTPESIRVTKIQRVSINPFAEEEEDDYENNYDDDLELGETRPAGVPSGLPKRVISAPRISLNPFWSDADEDEPEYDDDEGKLKPVPKPRKLRNYAGNSTNTATPEPKPRLSNHSLGGAAFGSNSSLSSCQSGGQSVRKKKPAPRPPLQLTETKNESPNESSLTSSPSTSVSHSPRLPNKSRKSKKAPLPPSSTPHLKDSNLPALGLNDVSPITTSEQIKIIQDDLNTSVSNQEWNNEKIVKDKVNENRRSQLFNVPNLVIPTADTTSEYVPNKSTYGKWKRKKGPAPSRPVPQRRMIKALPVCEFRKELDLIELQKQGLEKQGVRLEQIIRDRCEGPDRDENEFCDEDSVPIDVDDLILQLFEVVNEKNELSRREAELMYLQRQQRLEEEHAEVEYQIRCLMMQPELNKTDSDKAKEEELIQRLVEIVERRNEIIECLEMDRVREAEEDDSISTSMNSYVSKREEQQQQTDLGTGQKIDKEKAPEEVLSKKEKSKKSKKDKKKKKSSSSSDILDVDKDVDESETSITSLKEKKKKKFAIF